MKKNDAVISTLGYRPPVGTHLSKGSFIPLRTPYTTHATILVPNDQLDQLMHQIKNNITAILFHNGWHDVAIFKMDDDSNHIILFLHDDSGWTKNEVNIILNAECSRIIPLFYDTLVPVKSGDISQSRPESLCDGFSKSATPNKIRFEMSRQFDGDPMRKNAFAYMTGAKLNDEINNPHSLIIAQMTKEYDLHPNTNKLCGLSRSSIVFNTVYDTMYNRLKTCLDDEKTIYNDSDVSQIANLMIEKNAWSFTGSEEDATHAIRQDLDMLSDIF